MATTFSYATQADLKNYFNQFGDFDQKVQIFPTETSGNNHFFRDSGPVAAFFVNGSEQASPQADFDNVNGDGQWCYRADNNDLKFQASYYTATTVNNQLFEAGIDFETFIDQQLVNASLELNSLLDARYTTPIQPNVQSGQGSLSASEYDPIIIKSTCYIAASNLIRSRDPQSESAQSYYNLVSNAENTGLIDRLNQGHIKLSSEVDRKDSSGNINQITKTGSMTLVGTIGEFIGGRNGYDQIEILCTNAGAYGTAKCTVSYSSETRLAGKTSTGNIVTGGYDDWEGLGGLMVRFQGESMAVDDKWEIEVYSSEVSETNTMTNSIQTRRI